MDTVREQTAILADLLRRERTSLGDFLVALADFDAKRLWVDLEYTSLFHYLRAELHLSKAAAQYRKVAAELLQRVPAVIEPLRDGRLCLATSACAPRFRRHHTWLLGSRSRDPVPDRGSAPPPPTSLPVTDRQH